MSHNNANQLTAPKTDAVRYHWLRKHNATVLECVVERRGFRSTTPDAQRETWTEHEGWTVSTLPPSVGSFPTMDAAIDFAMKQGEEEEGGEENDGDPEKNQPEEEHHTAPLEDNTMTFRDYIAIRAMQAEIIALKGLPTQPYQAAREQIAELSYMMADTMVRASENK